MKTYRVAISHDEYQGTQYKNYRAKDEWDAVEQARAEGYKAFRCFTYEIKKPQSK